MAERKQGECMEARVVHVCNLDGSHKNLVAVVWDAERRVVVVDDSFSPQLRSEGFRQLRYLMASFGAAVCLASLDRAMEAA